jgi:RNA polymerase sigma-70 factor (ECF subfamily)
VRAIRLRFSIDDFPWLAERLERRLRARGEVPGPDFRQGVLAALPNLRAYAISLTRNRERADDLVQETILRALAHSETFTPGTKLTAWLCTILRNAFLTELRKRARELEDADGAYSARLTERPEQPGRLDLQHLRAAMDRLSADQRKVLILVGDTGLSYEDAAAICGCAVGTIKSRVSRARDRLAELLGYEDGDLAPDPLWTKPQGLSRG